MTRVSSRLSRFLASENGTMTVGGLIFTVMILAVGGLAVDVSNAINQRAQLQVTADATAHDALYTRNYTLTATADDAKTAALALGGCAGITPTREISSGYAIFDIQAAKAAGMDSVGVTWGAGVAEELAAEEPTALCSTVDELRKLLLG